MKCSALPGGAVPSGPLDESPRSVTFYIPPEGIGEMRRSACPRRPSAGMNTWRAGPVGYASVPWSVAVSAPLHCLAGCAIGEVLGMVVGTAAGLSNTATVVLAVALAFVFGYALTMRG